MNFIKCILDSLCIAVIIILVIKIGFWNMLALLILGVVFYILGTAIYLAIKTKGNKNG